MRRLRRQRLLKDGGDVRPGHQQVDARRADEREAESRGAGRELREVVRHRWVRRIYQPQHRGSVRPREEHMELCAQHDRPRGRGGRGCHPT